MTTDFGIASQLFVSLQPHNTVDMFSKAGLAILFVRHITLSSFHSSYSQCTGCYKSLNTFACLCFNTQAFFFMAHMHNTDDTTPFRGVNSSTKTFFFLSSPRIFYFPFFSFFLIRNRPWLGMDGLRKWLVE